MNGKVVDVFPISTAAFGIHSDWFTTYVPRLTQAAFLLLGVFLLISIGIMALRRFDNVDLEDKAWNLPVLIMTILAWPFIVVGIKDLVDVFNTFLIVEVFRIPWQGFGFPSRPDVNLLGWSAEGIARLMPNLAYWIIYTFYLIFFFLYSVMGPLVLAKGVLGDEISNFLEVVRELTVLYLWQSTVVVLVAFILPDIVSGREFPAQPPANFYLLSLLLGLLILFAPAITRKFTSHLGGSILPVGFRFGAMMLGMTAMGRLTSAGLSTAGMPAAVTGQVSQWPGRALTFQDFATRVSDKRNIQDLKRDREMLMSSIVQTAHDEEREEMEQQARESKLIELSQRARDEVQKNANRPEDG